MLSLILGTDNMVQLPAGVIVLKVLSSEGGLSNMAYTKAVLGVRVMQNKHWVLCLTGSKQGLSKLAGVFDEDVDVWDDKQI